MNIQELKDLISNSKLSEQEKINLIDLLDVQGTTPEVVKKIKDSIQNEIDSTFEQLGVTVDTADPKYQAKHKKMTKEIAVAQDKLAKTMVDVQKQAIKVQENTQKALDKIDADLALEEVQK